MQMVFSAAVSEEQKVREIAYQCLHEIAFLYYECLPSFMQFILDLTANAMKKESEVVQLQAIEFWSTICDVESDIARENEEVHSPFTWLAC
jgi:importin subunit beta-1